MKTCVLFPNAFSYNYMDGAVAHSLDAPTSQELHLSPQDLSETLPTRRRMRRSLSLFTSSAKEKTKENEKPKLLHVEDSAQIRLLVSIFLKNEFEIESVESGEEAIKHAKSNHYDLILMDINLGSGLDGFETSRKIRELAEYNETPIIALTTNDYDHVRDECISSRINAYIQKPFDKAYLLGTIQEINKHQAKKTS
ncbi:response regulator [Rhodohalobacter sp. 614A]|uniref:response regulator n=1 Tax=Rhodohalobacter sp. 614A TaxID=2908649 RepID=UPI001F2B5FC3|nr:response regulator [Rhodohalobacter sp. 614A]